jgi:hypothetical protein
MGDADKSGTRLCESCSNGRQTDAGDFVILGQVLCYPKTWKGVVATLIIGAVAVAVTYNLFVIGNSRTVDSVASIFGSGTQRFAVEADGKRTPYHTYQIGFWSPSPQTEASFRPSVSGDTLPAWQRAVSDDRVVEFGARLRSVSGVNGYRRTLVTGHGQTGYKAGYWWILALDERVEVDEIIKVYREFWKTTEKIYVEVIPPGDFGYKP